jgi:hypothetical protein
MSFHKNITPKIFHFSLILGMFDSPGFPLNSAILGNDKRGWGEWLLQHGSKTAIEFLTI